MIWKFLYCFLLVYALWESYLVGCLFFRLRSYFVGGLAVLPSTAETLPSAIEVSHKNLYYYLIFTIFIKFNFNKTTVFDTRLSYNPIACVTLYEIILLFINNALAEHVTH